MNIKITIEKHHKFACGCGKPCLKRSALSAIIHHRDRLNLHAFITLASGAGNLKGCGIKGAVIHNHKLRRNSVSLKKTRSPCDVSADLLC